MKRGKIFSLFLNRQVRGYAAGFTLVEMAVVVAIMSVLLTTGMQGYQLYQRNRTMVVTQEREAVVLNALERYRALNGHYPCPASLTALPDDPAYAVATDCLVAPPAGVFSALADKVRIGAVPGRTLGLPDDPLDERNRTRGVPDDYLYDMWGQRLTYAVTTSLTQTLPGSPVSDDGLISIVDTNGNSVITPAGYARYVVVSHGFDGLGGYTRDGVLHGACDAATKDGENCDMDDTFLYTLERSTAPGPDWYDDVVAVPALGIDSDPTVSPKPNRQIFNFTGFPQMWSKPLGFGTGAVAFVQCWGGGGGGGRNGNGGGGGGGGAYVQNMLPLSAFFGVETVMIGAGGAGGAGGDGGAGVNGGDGGATTFGAVLQAAGGRGGVRDFGGNGGMGGLLLAPASFGGDGGSIQGGRGIDDHGHALPPPIWQNPGDGGRAGGGGGPGGKGGPFDGPGGPGAGVVPGGGGGGSSSDGGGGRGAPGRCIVTTFD